MANYLDNEADQQYLELGEPSGISPTYIKQWYLTNVGQLNNLIGTTYLGVTGTITPQISGDAMSVFKEAFNVRYFDRLVHQNLGAGAFDWQFITEGDSTIKRVSKSETAKTYLGLKKESATNLRYFVDLYRYNNSQVQEVIDDNLTSYPDPLNMVKVLS